MTRFYKTAVTALLSLILLAPVCALAGTKRDKRKVAQPTRAELKQAQARLSEMGYGAGRNALVAFQKYEGLKATGQFSRADVEAILNARAPQPRDSGYRHVEIDLDRQVLLLIDDAGAVQKVLPVSTGSNKQYREKRASGLAYTPRGRFRVYSKLKGWRKSPLGLLYYPNYISDGIAIHGNPSVPNTPQSHGCIRIPMSESVAMSRELPIGSIVLIYDSKSFVSAKDWADSKQ
ncbi:MAG TPA: L,D-transpeptidase family protein [Pyrinomonadaceae bacterium]|nr:L,D-transpeptidase family protein [Pyrinomonadaceae bacterium]